MGKNLEPLYWKPMWATHLGSIKGCLDHLNIPVSEAWLMGATGQAFLMNIDSRVTAGGPTAWNTEMMVNLGSNLGYVIHGICAWKSEENFLEKQKLAWENTKRAIDQGYPCYGWELGLPEYYVVCGYNEHGYYYSGIGTAEYLCTIGSKHKEVFKQGIVGSELQADLKKHGIMVSDTTEIRYRFGCWVFVDERSGKQYNVLESADGRLLVHGEYEASSGHKRWQELGTSQTGLLEMYWVEPGFTTGDMDTLKEALEFSLDLSKRKSQSIFPGYHSGLDGYDCWIRALTDRSVDGFGHAYNAAVWSECRYFAAAFLKEANERLRGPLTPLFEMGVELYNNVHYHLSQVAEEFPFHQRQSYHIKETIRLEKALVHLRQARDFESRALETLSKLYRKLNDSVML